MEEKQPYTVKEISEYLRVSEKTVRKYISEGTLKAFKIGATGWRIPEESLKEFIQSKSN